MFTQILVLCEYQVVFSDLLLKNQVTFFLGVELGYFRCAFFELSLFFNFLKSLSSCSDQGFD